MRTGEQSECVEHRSPIRGTGDPAPGRSLLYDGRLWQKLALGLFLPTRNNCLPPALQVRQLRVQLFLELLNRNNSRQIFTLIIYNNAFASIYIDWVCAL